MRKLKDERRGVTKGVLWALTAISFLGCDDSQPTAVLDDRCGRPTGEVSRIIDGDTVELVDGRKIRLLMVDAPEVAKGSTPAECFADEARMLSEQLLLNHQVTLEWDEQCTDMFGRTLAHVKLRDRYANLVLLERGYAKMLVIPPNHAREQIYRMAEESARETYAGLWGACE